MLKPPSLYSCFLPAMMLGILFLVRCTTQMRSRFVLVLALVAVRAMIYQSSEVDGPWAPAFNLSATVLILG